MKCPDCESDMGQPRVARAGEGTQDEYTCPECYAVWRDRFVNVKKLERIG
jgi:Zn-finger nucleic acid-binding protein